MITADKEQLLTSLIDHPLALSKLGPSSAQPNVFEFRRERFRSCYAIILQCKGRVLGQTTKVPEYNINREGCRTITIQKKKKGDGNRSACFGWKSTKESMNEADRTRPLIFPMHQRQIASTILRPQCHDRGLPQCGAWEVPLHLASSAEGGTGV